jgi:N-acetyl sugar amidotransferase
MEAVLKWLVEASNPVTTELRRCARCLLPETHETLVFDEQGVCNICRAIEYKKTQIDWDAKRKELDALIEEYRGKYDYDCIVPYSGGKDSTWTLYYLVKHYNIKPLVVRFNHGFLRPTVRENSERVMRKLGVAVHEFTPNWHVVRKVMLRSFLEKGDFCWHCHTGIFAYPMQVAAKFNVPLVFWGEPSAEYTAYYGYDQAEEVDEKRFNRFVNLGISAQDMFVRLGGDVDPRDLKPFTYPPLSELRRIRYRSVCLGSYVPWDTKKQAQILGQELGWKGDEVEGRPPGYAYEKIECYMQGVRDWIKYIKRGYARSTHLASIDIRNQRLSREEGLRMVAEHEGKRPPSLDLFLDFVGLTEDEFYEIATSHAVSPWRFDRANVEVDKRLWDYDRWNREGAMPRTDAQKQLDRWRREQREQEAVAKTARA